MIDDTGTYLVHQRRVGQENRSQEPVKRLEHNDRDGVGTFAGHGGLTVMAAAHVVAAGTQWVGIAPRKLLQFAS